MRHPSLLIACCLASGLVIGCADGETSSRRPDGGVADATPSADAHVECVRNTDCEDDDVFCNGAPICQDGRCLPGSPPSCDDGVACTTDVCDASSDACRSTPSDALCGEASVCHPTMDCIPRGSCEFADQCDAPSGSQANMVAACVDGMCALACAEGFRDGDGLAANGCECAFAEGPDEPDAGFEDTNCDGIDGDLSRAILVSSAMGNDNATCGLELDRPCRTIGHAMTRAITASRRDLLLMAGLYDEVVVLRDGIRVFGGYDVRWVRGPRTSEAHRTVIRGGLDSSSGRYLTIRAQELTVAPTLENLIVVGPTPPAAASGASSYAIHVKNVVGLELVRTTIQQGDGASGAEGLAGLDAPSVVATAGMAGGAGGNALGSGPLVCDATSAGAGGSAGMNACPLGGGASNGGVGGSGGTRETFCFIRVCDAEDCYATAGRPGGAASVAPGSFGAGGAAGEGTRADGTVVCGAGERGLPGMQENGGPGLGATSARGALVGDDFVATTGTAGGVGRDGTGGGGGGGSGGCDLPGSGLNAYGAGGGGGGAGGCAARGGGVGGGGGGGSFGLFVIASPVTVSDSEFQRGRGGAGGRGGRGGQGQSGGPGGAGGAGVSGSAQAGGGGATGGHGGHGGGGGGGAGGPSVAIFTLSASVTASDVTVTGGEAGAAGPGGRSAPSAVGGEADGNDGLPGVVGILADTFDCAAPGGC